MDRPKRSGSALTFLLRAGVTVAAFVWLLRWVDLRQIWQAIRRTEPGGLAAACILYLISFVACCIRWKILLKPIQTLPFRNLFRWFLIGAFFNTLLPTTIGGDLIRIHEAGKAIGNWPRAAATVLLDRMCGFTAMFAIGAAATLIILQKIQHPLIAQGVLAMLIIFSVAATGFASQRWFNALTAPLKWFRLKALRTAAQETRDLMVSYGKHPQAILLALGISFLVQALNMWLFWTVAQAMHLNIPFWSVLVFVPILMTIAMLPISLNGLGVREGAAVVLFGSVGLPAAQAVSLSLVCTLIPALSGLWGAWAWITYRCKTEKK
ncbi:MAG: flippase-like domain-containing protein [Candidatus Omnitrophica bacterium]|nr:flippase-like domain-containing protein [Candidatus Omnitrophota bacterium]